MKIEISEPFADTLGLDGVLVTVRFGGEWQPTTGGSGPPHNHAMCGVYRFTTHGLAADEVAARLDRVSSFHAAKEAFHAAADARQKRTGESIDVRLRLRDHGIEITIGIDADLFTSTHAEIPHIEDAIASAKRRVSDRGSASRHVAEVRRALGL